jgi:hypothetical protein
VTLRPLLLAVAAGTLAPAAGASPPLKIAVLPGVEALRPIPPLAPPQAPVTEAPRLRGTVSAEERVVVGIAADGRPQTVAVEQRLAVRTLGDYAFFIPAPAVTVVAAAGSESQPGFRPNQIVWQGFSPRRRLLAARAELRRADSVPALPFRVRVSGAPVRRGPFEIAITIEDATRSPATGLTGDAVRPDVNRALDALRAAARIGRPIVGQVVRIRGETRRLQVAVTAPLRVRAWVSFPAGAVRLGTPMRFTRRLDGGVLRLTVRGVARRTAAPRLRIVATPAVAAALPPQSARTLRAAVAGYLRYARTRQYQAFLANPDPRGPSATTYVYETVEASAAVPPPPPSDDDSSLPTALVAGALVLVGAGLVVLWAHL